MTPLGDVRETASPAGSTSYTIPLHQRGYFRRRGRALQERAQWRRRYTPETVVISNAGGRIHLHEAPEGAVLTTGGGNINVHTAEKFVSASTGGGDIDIRLEHGWVKAATGAGDIEVLIENGGGKDDIVLISGNGDIRLRVPKDHGLTFDIDLSYTRSSSRNFRIRSDLDIDIEETEEWEKEHGNWRKHIYGTGGVSGGGQRVRIRTTNGSIYIQTD